MSSLSSAKHFLDLRSIWQTWWPLAGSWLLMGLELPLLSAVLARLPDPDIHLAAYGGLVFPISLLIEAPVIMLLAASTALSKNWTSYRLLRRFMVFLAMPLTITHILIAFTPLYDAIVSGFLEVPDEIVEPGRWGLMLMTPWTGAIAIRRFQQGVLIRAGRSKYIAKGTALRLTVNTLTLAAGYVAETLPGIVVGTSAIALGVISEAIYIDIRTKPVVTGMKERQVHEDDSLSMKDLWTFYMHLAITPILMLLALPIGSAALARMPDALTSMAVLPVVIGLSFTFRSLGLAYHEVVVALIDKPGAALNLQLFANRLALGTSGLLFVITATPLSHFWFSVIAGLPTELAELGMTCLWIVVLLPALTVLESWYQGILVYSHQTRAVTESVLVYLACSSTILMMGILLQTWTGLYVNLIATLAGFFLQTIWLQFRSRHTRRDLLKSVLTPSPASSF